jgi:hypothetical protein
MTALDQPPAGEGLRNRKAVQQQLSDAEERETRSCVTRSPQREGPRQSMTGQEVAKDESKATKIAVRLVSGGCMVRLSELSRVYNIVIYRQAPVPLFVILLGIEP